MRASSIKRGMFIDGVRVAATSPVVASGRHMIRVKFANGHRDVFPDQVVTGVRTRLTLAAGPVSQGWFVSAQPKVRVSDGVWRGEKVGTKKEYLVSVLPAFNK
jgi:hypothetical protein